MDHILSPANPCGPVRVKYLCKSKHEEYDHGDYHGYPERRGLDARKLSKGDLQGSSSAEVANFLQQWLYFGILEEFFKLANIPHQASDYVVENKSDRYKWLKSLAGVSARPTSIDYEAVEKKNLWIESTPLVVRLNAWQNIEAALAPEMKRNHGKKMLAVLDDADEFLGICTYNKLSKPDSSAVFDAVLPQDLEISIRVLIDTLSIIGWNVYHIGLRSESRQKEYNFFRRMELCGWCPGFLYPYKRTFGDAVFLYYASLLGPPKGLKDHSRCSPVACLANQINNGTDIPRHINEDTVHVPGAFITEGRCDCTNECVDLGQLNTIIQSGDVPLISVRWPQPSDLKDPQGLQFKVVRRRPEILYVAFSHVWSDGLGNPSGNSLPACQVHTLRTLLWNLRHDTTTWEGERLLRSHLRNRPDATTSIGMLPHGWQLCRDAEGRTFFKDQNTQTTTWEDPRPHPQDTVELPAGWIKSYNEYGFAYFVNHNTRKTTWLDPRANVRNLKDMSETFEPDSQLYFWLDTLCIPRFPNDTQDQSLCLLTKDSRQKAIKRMKEIYRDAECMLALDSEMLRCSITSPPLELLTKLLFSGWQSRLWTLQEATMAHTIYVQLKDGVKRLETLADELETQMKRGDFDTTPSLPIMVLRQCFIPRILNGSLKQDGYHPHYAALDALRTRSTSRPSDEPSCVASILELNLDKVLEGQEGDQWHRFLKILVKRTDSALLFDSCEKSNKEGYSWAPKTFLAPRSLGQCYLLIPNAPTPHAILTFQGLELVSPGINFEPPEKPLSKHFTISERRYEQNFYAIMVFDSKYSDEENSQHLEAIRPPVQSLLSLILSKPLSADLPIRAALVRRNDLEEEIILGKFITAVYVQEMPKEQLSERYYSTHVATANSFLGDNDPNLSTNLKGSVTSEDQRWRIR